MGRLSIIIRLRMIQQCDLALLLELVHEVDGVERIRFASPHPRHVTPRLIADDARLPKVCKHLHLPVQSGSNPVLTRMRRRYTRASATSSWSRR